MTNKVNTLDWHDENCQQNRHFIEESKKFMRNLTQQAMNSPTDDEQSRQRQNNQRYQQQIIQATVEGLEADTREYEAEVNQARKQGQQQFQRGQRQQKAA